MSNVENNPAWQQGTLDSWGIPTAPTPTPYPGRPYAPGYTPPPEDATPVPASTAEDKTHPPTDPFDYAHYKAPYGINQADRIGLTMSHMVTPVQDSVIRQQVHFPFSKGIAPDERAALAANQSAANASMQANAVTGDGSRVRGSNTAITGNVLQALAGTEGEFAKLKADFYNRQGERYDAQKEKEMMANTAYAQQYTEQMNAARSKNLAERNNYLTTLGQGSAQALKNAAQTSWINSMHNRSPFYIDPNTGRPAYNPNFQPDLNGVGTSGDQDKLAQLVKYYSKYTSDPDKALALAHKDFTNDRVRRTTSPFNPKATKTSESYSPALQGDYYSADQGYNTGFGY